MKKTMRPSGEICGSDTHSTSKTSRAASFVDDGVCCAPLDAVKKATTAGSARWKRFMGVRRQRWGSAYAITKLQRRKISPYGPLARGCPVWPAGDALSGEGSRLQETVSCETAF